MINLFKPPTNALESLLINAEMWEITCEWQPVVYKKHSGAEIHMHRYTRQGEPEIWCPLFHKPVVDDMEDSED